MKRINFKFLRESYTYDGLVNFICENIPDCKKHYRFLELSRDFVDREYPYVMMDFPEFRDMNLDKCFDILKQFLTHYKDSNNSARTCRMIKKLGNRGASISRLLLRISHLKYH